METLGSSLALVGLPFATLLLSLSLQQWWRLRTLRKQVQAKEIASSIPKHQIKDLKFLLKATCTKSVVWKRDVEVGSNEIVFNCLPLHKYFLQMMKSVNTEASLADRKDDCQWTDDQGQVFPSPMLEVTSHHLLAVNYQYQSLFDSPDSPGLFGTILKYMLATIAAILHAPLGLDRRREDTLIKGPHWGTLKFSVSLLTGAPVLLCCSFRDGELVPEIVGLSREDIVDCLEAKESRRMALVFFAAFSLFYFLRKSMPIVSWIWRGAKNFLENASKQDEGKNPRPYRPKQVDEDSSCIICFANCRNIVFCECKHMIICDQCFRAEGNPIIECPYCRRAIREDFVSLMTYRQGQDELRSSIFLDESRISQQEPPLR